MFPIFGYEKFLFIVLVICLVAPVFCETDTTQHDCEMENNLYNFWEPPRTAMSIQEAVITDKRYQNHDVAWQRPGCGRCGLLPGAGPGQFRNLYPDWACTYWDIHFHMPLGSKLTLKGQYPHSRYASFTIGNQLNGKGHIGAGSYILAQNITPDPGSTNPFVSSNSRNATPRNFTLHIVQGNSSTNPENNTLYSGTTSDNQPIRLSFRIYLVDDGYDGTGNRKLYDEGPLYGHPLPQLSLDLINHKGITGPELLKILQVQKIDDPPGYSQEEWLHLIDFSDDPVNAPALVEPVFQVYYNNEYSVTSSFLGTDWKLRALLFPPNFQGGFANNPNTRYSYSMYSFSYGEMFVIRAKLPTHPTTRRGDPEWPVNRTQVQYYSLTTGAGPSWGEGYDTVYDQQLTVGKDGYYTVVVSIPMIKPSVAAINAGVHWLDPGAGEGRYVRARNWVGVVYVRFQNPDPDWEESPLKIPPPTVEQPIPQDPIIMKEYYPIGLYMSQEEFEKSWPLWY